MAGAIFGWSHFWPEPFWQEPFLAGAIFVSGAGATFTTSLTVSVPAAAARAAQPPPRARARARSGNRNRNQRSGNRNRNQTLHIAGFCRGGWRARARARARALELLAVEQLALDLLESLRGRVTLHNVYGGEWIYKTTSTPLPSSARGFTINARAQRGPGRVTRAVTRLVRLVRREGRDLSG